jgi:hypothetical protein
MYFFLIYFSLPAIKAIVITEIHRSATYHPNSTCAFLGNTSLPTDASIQSCIWECVNKDNCQTAVFYNDGKFCTMFAESCELGKIQPSGNVSASTICYQKNQGKMIFCYDIEETSFLSDYYHVFNYYDINSSRKRDDNVSY